MPAQRNVTQLALPEFGTKAALPLHDAIVRHAQDPAVKPMDFANQDAGIMHHDLLIELGRVDMNLEDLAMQDRADTQQQETLRRKLSSYRCRLREALDKLPD